MSRWVNAHGKISLAGFPYSVGATYAGEPVEVVVAGGLVDILHAGVVVATHAQRLRADQADRAPRARVSRRARDATAGLTVTRLANNTGVITFADKTYAAGRRWAHTSIDVTIVAGSVQLSKDGKVFTARFGTGPGPVMFDRICAGNSIRHLLTAPSSPTTTGKIERLHKTMRAEFFTPMTGRSPRWRSCRRRWMPG